VSPIRVTALLQRIQHLLTENAPNACVTDSLSVTYAVGRRRAGGR